MTGWFLRRVAPAAVAAAIAGTTAFAQDMPGMRMPPAPAGVPMERLASGTTWTPDAVVLPSRQFMAGDWHVMLPGFAFGQYIAQGGPRGGSQWGSLNWGMVMAARDVAGGRLQARAMLSGDPATIQGGGYPLLLQSGESYKGVALRDRQHPHDALMELAVAYERELTPSLAISAYVAPAGEPALGPVAFMHRPSAMDNPFAPLGHHWQDATHISFGVATFGVFGRRWKLEGSLFNGREPDDERWNLDLRPLTSWSGRLTVNPADAWTATIGYGDIEDAEAHAPGVAVHRVAASVMHGRTLAGGGQWSTTLVAGANGVGHDGWTSSVLLESEAVLDDRNTILGRVEHVQKSAEDLSLGPAFGHDERFGVVALSAGYIREVARGTGATLGVGAIGTINLVSSRLEPEYGSRTPLGIAVFLRLRPSFQRAHAMPGMHHGGGTYDAR